MPKHKSTHKGNVLVVVMLVMLALILSGGLYWYMKVNKPLTSSQAPAISTPVVSNSMESLDENWNKYTNKQIGFSIKVPKKAISFNGGCEYSTEDGDHSYRPVSKEVPLQVLENQNDVYIVPAYSYELSGKTIENSIFYFSKCDKTDIDLNSILNMSENKFLGPHLKFFSQNVVNDTQLEQFIKDSYGKDCKLGKKSPLSQVGAYDVEIDGIVSPSDDSKECVVNYMYSIRYLPSKNKVVAWNLGQACNFAYPTQMDCQDTEMSSSFLFE